MGKGSSTYGVGYRMWTRLTNPGRDWVSKLQQPESRVGVILFDKERDSYWAPALEEYLIGQLNPVLNVVEKRRA